MFAAYKSERGQQELRLMKTAARSEQAADGRGGCPQVVARGPLGFPMDARDETCSRVAEQATGGLSSPPGFNTERD